MLLVGSKKKRILQALIDKKKNTAGIDSIFDDHRLLLRIGRFFAEALLIVSASYRIEKKITWGCTLTDIRRSFILLRIRWFFAEALLMISASYRIEKKKLLESAYWLIFDDHRLVLRICWFFAEALIILSASYRIEKKNYLRVHIAPIRRLLISAQNSLIFAEALLIDSASYRIEQKELLEGAQSTDIRRSDQ